MTLSLAKSPPASLLVSNKRQQENMDPLQQQQFSNICRNKQQELHENGQDQQQQQQQQQESRRLASFLARQEETTGELDELGPAEAAEGSPTSSSAVDKHNPVMGIFFKVWSLVKVSKARHNSKLRRQNSDSAHQFEYISGAELAGGSSSAAAGVSRRRQLQDAHFRRAGSQPAGPSTSASTASASASNPNRLQVLGASAHTPGTNSTSSGVSSASSGSAGFRRHLSAHSLRRAGVLAAVANQQHQQQQQPQQVSKKASWTSKIRRSATSVNQADLGTFVAGRYRLASSSSAASQQQPCTAPVMLPAPVRQLSSSSEPGAPSDVDEPSGGDDELGGETPSLARAAAAAAAAEDEDSQDNDIYSTPNDSIQSVPSGGSLLVSQQQHQQQQPIVKSFSTSNFGHLLARDERLATLAQAQATIGEEDQAPSDLRQDPQQQQRRRPRQAAASLQGSRFFISSSSSEDSHEARPIQAGSGAFSCQAAHQPTNRLHQRHLAPAQPVALQPGVHYHASRPDSLLVGGVAGGGPQLIELVPTPGYLHQQATAGDFHVHGRRHAPGLWRRPARVAMLPNSVSLHDNCKLAEAGAGELSKDDPSHAPAEEEPEYRLAQLLLESGARPDARDSQGHTALMLAVLADNLAAVKCLLERKSPSGGGLEKAAAAAANPNETNQLGLSALDLLCSKPPTRQRLQMLRLLVEAGAELDGGGGGHLATRGDPRKGPSDNRCDLGRQRPLDRLIGLHHPQQADKLAYVELLLQAGAKLGSSTWLEAHNKPDVQLRLLKKLCQDGYFLYKKGSIEAAVFRFEYALKRVAELEQQLAANRRHLGGPAPIQGWLHGLPHLADLPAAARQIKYQTYLGLSRCERKRRFYKRALEFAHLAILVDSTSYEGFYSKAHILKDLGELDDALLAIHQTARLVEESSRQVRLELEQLERREEALGALGYLWPPPSAAVAEPNADFRSELAGNLEYLEEAKRFIGRLKAEILADKAASSPPPPPQKTTTTTASSSQLAQAVG